MLQHALGVTMSIQFSSHLAGLLKQRTSPGVVALAAQKAQTNGGQQQPVADPRVGRRLAQSALGLRNAGAILSQRPIHVAAFKAVASFTVHGGQRARFAQAVRRLQCTLQTALLLGGFPAHTRPCGAGQSQSNRLGLSMVALLATVQQFVGEFTGHQLKHALLQDVANQRRICRTAGVPQGRQGVALLQFFLGQLGFFFSQRGQRQARVPLLHPYFAQVQAQINLLRRASVAAELN